MTAPTALLVGAAGGILSEVALGLAKAGHPLVLLDRDADAVDELAQRLKEYAPTDAVHGDVTDLATAAELFAELARRHQPGVLVNGVGGDTRVIRYADLTVEHFEQSYLENMLSTFIAIKAVGPGMAGRGRGRIVNFASAGGRTYSHFNNAGYVAAKAAVIGMTKQIAYELAPTGVVVNVVAHGPIATERVAAAWERRDPAQKAAVLSKLPLGRMGTVAEAVGSVLYLCSDSAGFTTGTVIDVNGGLYM
jgi:NAD(P)-dependent dehydrogenase (short-subunit alcohol dehydrogenase family)